MDAVPVRRGCGTQCSAAATKYALGEVETERERGCFWTAYSCGGTVDFGSACYLEYMDSSLSKLEPVIELEHKEGGHHQVSTARMVVVGEARRSAVHTANRLTACVNISSGHVPISHF